MTLCAQRAYDKQSANVGRYAVQHASDDVAYVWNTTTASRIRRRVNVDKFTCTCTFIDQYDIPCRHIIAALASQSKRDNVYIGFAECYHADKFESSFWYKATFVPLTHELQDDETWLPPLVTKKHGRPKTRRIRSAGEDIEKVTYRCTKCKQPGHNKRSCAVV